VHDPVGAIFGPKVMIINQSAGSGGDAMPWYFRKAELGTLVGTRTWGGLVGIGGYPIAARRRHVTAPRYAIYGLHGEWEVRRPWNRSRRCRRRVAQPQTLLPATIWASN
jgi:tricorn protease